MKFKKNLLIGSAFSIIVGSSFCVVSTIKSNQLIRNDIDSSNIKTNIDSTSTNNAIVPVEQFYQLPNLSTKMGPIVSYGSQITLLDWFAAKKWSIDLLDEKYKKYLPGEKNSTDTFIVYNKRAFINWSLDSINNILYVLTGSSYKNGTSGNVYPQNIIKIDATNGEVLNFYKLPGRTNDVNHGFGDTGLYYQIQVLTDGNVSVYSQGNGDWGYNWLLDPKTGSLTFSDASKFPENRDIFSAIGKDEEKRSRLTWGKYLVPITKNVNAMLVVDRSTANSYYSTATGDLWMYLVDNNFRKIKVSSNSEWANGIRIKNIWTFESEGGTNSSNSNDQGWSYRYGDKFCKSYYRTLDGKTYFTAYSDFFVFYPEFSESYGIKFARLNLNGKGISSFSMDVNENVFFKYINHDSIYKLIILGDTAATTNFSIASYFNMGNSTDSYIRDYSENYIIYNVDGYTGSLMMINAKFITHGQFIVEADKENQEVKNKNYGLAVAIVPNEYDDRIGDTKGCLNGPDSFLKASDFEISDSILKSKLPSEITQNDITLLNGGFFTENKTTNDKGDLLYKPFTISNINDEKGSFEITTYLDQIPWFTTTLPKDAIPTKISKSYPLKGGISAQTIYSKISWNTDLTNDYDFRNMLPSKVLLSDIYELDPFQVSFSSQVVLDSKGNQLYPQKTYSINLRNDDTGKIVIEVNYQYVPLGTDVSTVLSHTSAHEYTIFKKNDIKQFYFAGSSSSASSSSTHDINIKNVPQLISLSQSNFLPSSFDETNEDLLVQFVDTQKSTGYPISRMNFDFIPNDINGTLTIVAKLDDNYYGDNTPTTFEQVYTGFNKISDYNFSFKNTITSVAGSNISNLLPSSISEGDVINYFVNFKGFVSSDFTVNLYPNNENGSISIDVILNSNYSNLLGNSNGFQDYKISNTYYGFMTTESYNKQYTISFRNNDDAHLADLKKLTTNEIAQMLGVNASGSSSSNPPGLTIGEEHYKNLNDLTQRLLLSYIGEKIPQTNWYNNPNIITTMNFDNNAGTMNILLIIKKEILEGFESDLNIVTSFSGFANGNVILTKDNLSFIDNDLLKTTVEQSQTMSASEFGNWLKQSNENLMKIISYVSGQYIELLDTQDYELTIQANDIYKTILIIIKFNNVKNSESLDTYSVQYIL